MAKASDNPFPSLLVVPGAAPASPASGQRLYLDSADGNKLKRKDSAGVVTTIEGGAGGGGSGPASLSRLYTPASGSTTVDEFDDASLDPAWVRVDKAGGAARATWTEDAGVLSVATAGGDAAAEMHALMRPLGTALASGDGFETCFITFGPNLVNFVMAGLALADGVTPGSGSQVVTLCYGSATTPPKLDSTITAMTGYQTQGAYGAALNTPPYVRTFQRLTYRGANQWRQDLSIDGVSWLKSALHTVAVTPTYAGLWASSWGTATAGMASFEYLRRVTGVA